MLSLAETPASSNDELFASLLRKSQTDLSCYVWSLVRDVNAVDDIMQDIAIALWRKFEDYDPERPFLPWARRFAFYQVLKHRQRQRRQRWIVREDVLIDQLPAPGAEDQRLQAQREALESCLRSLPAADRELLHCRYNSRETIQQMAKRTRISVHKLYHALDRIREELMTSITASLRAKGWEC